MNHLLYSLLEARPFDPPRWADVLIVGSCAAVFAWIWWESRRW